MTTCHKNVHYFWVPRVVVEHRFDCIPFSELMLLANIIGKGKLLQQYKLIPTPCYFCHLRPPGYILDVLSTLYPENIIPFHPPGQTQFSLSNLVPLFCQLLLPFGHQPKSVSQRQFFQSYFPVRSNLFEDKRESFTLPPLSNDKQDWWKT